MRLLPNLVCFLAAFAPAVALAEQADLKRGVLTIYFENDLFAGTDRYYTNGVKISWSSADLEKFSETPYASPLLPVLDRIPFVNDPAYQKNLTFVLGQNIYTPDNTEATEPVPGDRPYAGWLYVGAGLAWKNADVRNTLGLNIGVIGSWSLAEQAQRTVHEIRGLDVPNGFNNQLHNELGVVLFYERTWRWPHHDRRVGFDWEFLPHAGITVGNVYDHVNLGGELRLGLNLPDDFGTPAIGPTATTSTPVEGSQQAGRARKFDLGAYVFGRADGRAIARNIFLDGSTFGHSVSVDKEYFVADISVGAAVNYKNTKFTYALVYRTKEFTTQKEDGQVFGSVSVTFAF